jgi:carboxymethylenebutenolidase
LSQQSRSQYLALPRSGTGPGVLVLHAWWGLTDFIRDFCERLAQEGFVALAPDLFSGTVARTVEDAERHLHKFDEEHIAPPIVMTAVEELRKHPAVTGNGLGVVGFSMGASWALWLAEEKPDLIRAVALFYGTNGGGGDFRQSKAAFLGNFAEKDPYEPEEGIKELEKNLKSVNRPTTFYTYPGTGHWFFESDRQDTYHAQAAQLAWDRTLAFLCEQLKHVSRGSGSA